jgi:hypothetical protein
MPKETNKKKNCKRNLNFSTKSTLNHGEKCDWSSGVISLNKNSESGFVHEKKRKNLALLNISMNFPARFKFFNGIWCVYGHAQKPCYLTWFSCWFLIPMKDLTFSFWYCFFFGIHLLDWTSVHFVAWMLMVYLELWYWMWFKVLFLFLMY